MNYSPANATANGTALFRRALRDPPSNQLAHAQRDSSMRHIAAIEALVEATGRPFDEIARVYQRELAAFAARALVLDFLPVLASKRVRHLYQS